MSNKRLIDYLDLSAENSLSAIETENISISGATENVVQHSSMFYQPFSEDVCQTICNIFEECMATATNSTRRTALAKIERLISSSDDQEVPTIESLLYASRVANSKIKNDAVFFDELAKDVAQCYLFNSESAFEVVKHIFKAWNWDCQVGLALVGAIDAEKNPVKREQLLSEMDKYIDAKGDKTHQLLLYKVKAMVTRGSEYCAKLFDVVENLNGNKYNIDTQIAGVIKQEAAFIFKGNEDILNGSYPQNVLARSTIKDLKQIMGFNETDNIVEMIKQGNEDDDVRENILRRMSNDRTNVERYCAIIRKNHLNSYIDVLDELICDYELNLHNKCCVALTFTQMIKGRRDRFEDFIDDSDFPDDFIYLLQYVFYGRRGGSYLQDAIEEYFSDDCSPLLKKGVTHTTKYDNEVSNAVISVFASLLEADREETDSEILEKFDALLQDQKSTIRNSVTKGSTFLGVFTSLLHDSSVNLDAYPAFFDEMISIVDHCPENTVKGFWYDMYQKTDNPQRKTIIRNKMGDIDVNS